MDVVAILGELDCHLLTDHSHVGADGSHKCDEELRLVGKATRAGTITHARIKSGAGSRARAHLECRKCDRAATNFAVPAGVSAGENAACSDFLLACRDVTRYANWFKPMLDPRSHVRSHRYCVPHSGRMPRSGHRTWSPAEEAPGETAEFGLRECSRFARRGRVPCRPRRSRAHGPKDAPDCSDRAAHLLSGATRWSCQHRSLAVRAAAGNGGAACRTDRCRTARSDRGSWSASLRRGGRSPSAS